MQKTAKFTFNENVEPAFLEQRISQAIATAETLFGAPRVRLAAGYFVDPDGHRCILDISTEIGERIAEFFIANLLQHLAPHEFTVERVTRPSGGRDAR